MLARHAVFGLGQSNSSRAAMDFKEKAGAFSLNTPCNISRSAGRISGLEKEGEA